MSGAGRLALAVVALTSGVAIAGCGGGGGNLPTSLPSAPSVSLPGSLPTVTRTTSSEPTTASPTTETITETATTSPSAPASDSESTTPWGWIAAAAILLVLVVLIGGWALGRRGAARRAWSPQALQASSDGTALHDTVLGELIAAERGNRPEQWSAIAAAGDRLSASLQRLGTSSPDDQATHAVQTAVAALSTVRSAVAIAAGAPAGTPLDQEASRTVRQRLEDMAAAMRQLESAAGSG
jgi:uncharacterized protein HemX